MFGTSPGALLVADGVWGCVRRRRTVPEAFVTHVMHQVDVAEAMQAVHEALLAVLVDLGERQAGRAQRRRVLARAGSQAGVQRGSVGAHARQQHEKTLLHGPRGSV